MPSHYLNQCWYIFNWTPRNKLQWDFNRNSYIFIQENPFENVVSKMAAICLVPNVIILLLLKTENFGRTLKPRVLNPLAFVTGSSAMVLTHLSLDKLTSILADDNLKCIFLNGNDKILIRISLQFVPTSLINYKPALAQVMAWRQTGDKPLPEPMLIRFTDTYVRY